MSEFKFACPVCGQHMMCDASHGGQVMECPTCFQKITAPQAPAADGKFILTGTKVTEKKISARGPAAAGPAAAEKKFPAAILVGVIVLVLAAGAGVYFFGGKIFHFGAAGWQSGDIGAVHAAGAFSLDQGVFTVSGDGVDIWDKADSFRYVFQPLNGDGTLTARVLKIKNTDQWAKAGVMARESLEAGSRFAAVLVTPAQGITYQFRDRAAAPASEVQHVPNLAAPYWIRLVRQGNAFTAYSSANGTAWNKLGTTTIAMGGQLYAGLAVCSHKDGTLCPAQFDNVTLQTNANISAPAPVAAPPPPKLVAPPANDTNWMLTLDGAVTPNSAVVGRIHGQDFIVERANFQNGTLILRAGTKGALEFGVQINFGGAPPEALAGKAINVSADTEKAALVTLRWKDANGVQKAAYDVGYALRLEFGALAKDHLPGKIYLCLPDAEKSYLMGKFNASIIKPKPKPATPPPAK